MRVSIDAWDPSYGTAGDAEGGAEGGASPTVNLAVERPPTQWGPIRPPPPGGTTSAPEVLVFVDGVRRVEARVWVEPDGRDGEDGDGQELAAGLCASWAAGALRCDGRAELVGAEVGRGLFTPSRHVADLVTAHGRFTACPTAAGTPEALSLALQERMTATEVAVAAAACVDGGLLVVDGPLRGRQHLNGAVGLVKTHQVDYLGPPLRPIRRALAPGERTPVFTIGTTWSRHSWYLRLPGAGSSGPMAGIVRLECAATLAPHDAVALADATAVALPRFASAPAKEARAPQNLFPIAGLERELRRRLGDARLLYRSLLAAA